MELPDAMFGRRSVRKYHNKPIGDEILHEILNAALWAPSASNYQPWYFVVIRTPQELDNLRDLLVLAAQRSKADLEQRFSAHPEVIKDTLTFMENMGGAPVCILAFLHKNAEAEQQISNIQSVAAAIQNITLAAYNKGIGTCWTTGSLRAKEAIQERYGQGRGDYLAMLAMGYGDFPTQGPKRKGDRVVFI